MKTVIDGVTITLTDEQIKEVQKQSKISKYKDFTDIKSYMDACEYLKKDINHKVSARKQLKTIAKALNSFEKGKFPDHNNTSQKKYYPYFDCSSGGFRFYGSGLRFSRFFGVVFYYRDQDISNYAGKQFIELYKKLAKIKVDSLKF